MKKIEIIPAILPKDFAELEYKVELVKGFVKTLQIDVCDGQFTPGASWPYKRDDNSFQEILREERGLPAWQDFNFEFDLMINNPEEVVDEWVIAGATRIILHAECKGDIEDAIDRLRDRTEIGLALNIETDIEVIETHKANIQFVQCMGIDNIGFQAQAFDAKVIEKVRAIRTKHPEMIISVDGGVSLENAPKLIEAGANRLVVGSAIFDSDNVIEAVQRFKKLQATDMV